jgi:hypothetical protein
MKKRIIKCKECVFVKTINTVFICSINQTKFITPKNTNKHCPLKNENTLLQIYKQISKQY